MLSLKELPVPRMFVLTIAPGEELYDELERIMVKQKWQEVYILNGLGSLRLAETEHPLGLDLPPVCEPFTVDGPLEIASLVGTVRFEGESPFVHLHGSFVKNSKEVYGGAVNRGTTAYRGVEMFLMIVQ